MGCLSLDHVVVSEKTRFHFKLEYLDTLRMSSHPDTRSPEMIPLFSQ